MGHGLPLDGLEQEIKEILYGYVKVESISGTASERDAAEYFLDFFQSKPYWQEHPEYAGSVPALNDACGRRAAFAMVRGAGSDTVVLFHHNDVVTADNYKLLRPLAFSPDELERALLEQKDAFSPEVTADLESGQWLYGRGVSDMKGGGSIQMALLRRYSELVRQDPAALPGTIIVLAVPDEENMSAGMRAAAPLLAELKETYGLRYRLAVDSEPQFRTDMERGLFSVGSVGKLLPFVYVRGFLSHAGKPFAGVNSVNVLSEIVRRTELNVDFSDVVEGEAAPPPVWLYLRDNKQLYDVSLPLSAAGCLSVLTLRQTPGEVLARLRDICQESFEAVVEEMNRQYAGLMASVGKPADPLPWRAKVVDFAALYSEAKADRGEAFEAAYQEELGRLAQRYNGGEINLMNCTLSLVDFVFNYIDDLSPRVVYGLVPPYYPCVTNVFLEGLPDAVGNLCGTLDRFTRAEYGQEYIYENFFTGVSDMSYTSVSGAAEILQSLRSAMPLLDKLYDVPMEAVEQISMPCINIGPWGKDAHQMTERVLKQDLFYRTPRILLRALEEILPDA